MSLKITLLALTLISSLAPLQARAGRCERVFNEPSSGTPPVPQSPLNERGSFQPITLPNGTMIPGATLHHIFHGDLQPLTLKTGGTEQKAVGIDGGVHTRAALDAFLQMRPDLDRQLEANPTFLRSYPNGVLKVFFPAEAFSYTGQMSQHQVKDADGKTIDAGAKSYFPATWTDAEILTAVETAAQSPEAQQALNGITAGQTTRAVSLVNDVRIKVILKAGTPVKLVSAYPNGDQGAPPNPVSPP